MGDEMFPAIASFRREFAEGEVLWKYAIEAADAFVNSPDRLLGTPALLSYPGFIDSEQFKRANTSGGFPSARTLLTPEGGKIKKEMERRSACRMQRS
jgi:hypothetical protein